MRGNTLRPLLVLYLWTSASIHPGWALLDADDEGDRPATLVQIS
jgi:hypothetical protein